MEEYLDIGIVWIFRNLGRIFGYRDHMDIFRNLWKSIWI